MTITVDDYEELTVEEALRRLFKSVRWSVWDLEDGSIEIYYQPGFPRETIEAYLEVVKPGLNYKLSEMVF
jgi:hypothetical protein